MKLMFSILVFVIAVFFSLPAMAQHEGHGGAPAGGEKKAAPPQDAEASPSRTFLLAENVKASFSIMAMADHKKMLKDMNMKVEVEPQATHNIAVTLTDTVGNQPIGGAVVKMKVIDPKGKEQIKLLDFVQAMNQFAGDFMLAGKGKYQILILFKSGAKKQSAGFYYTLK